MADAEQARRRAAEADRLLREPLLMEAFEAVEQAAYQQLLTVPWWHPRGDFRRRVLADKINTIHGLKEELDGMIRNGPREPKRRA